MTGKEEDDLSSLFSEVQRFINIQIPDVQPGVDYLTNDVPVFPEQAPTERQRSYAFRFVIALSNELEKENPHQPSAITPAGVLERFTHFKAAAEREARERQRRAQGTPPPPRSSRPDPFDDAAWNIPDITLIHAVGEAKREYAHYYQLATDPVTYRKFYRLGMDDARALDSARDWMKTAQKHLAIQKLIQQAIDLQNNPGSSPSGTPPG